ncbi:MAG: bifunctional phosphopantothenoylcysteine decarboxylase/phosphopantothenate--cysteine ligase CoaBC [Marichromatium sp.]|nr:bifunctional phosphopantothenoylcysteine decarboxylase/phosphopantothenate--cysteine ligase CoaBC [Marichromatium sp.]
MELLKGRNILLGVTGSIAAYKSVELARLLIKAGANVRVIMSEEAKRFITPLTLEAITGNAVLEAGSESWSNDLNHIHIHRWAELFCIVPTTANTLNKLAHGIADNLLLQTALACPSPLLLAPAANTHMIEHPATKEAMRLLESRGATIIAPISKLLACQIQGKGAMAEPQTVFYHIARRLLAESSLTGQNVLVTGGGTKESVDAVRCLSNHSSGKMAEALALALFLKGANVTLLTSVPANAATLPFSVLSFTDTASLKTALFGALETHDTLFMAAAVSDYLPKNSHKEKVKKSAMGATWSLELVENEDILTQAAQQGARCIGFKAETDATMAKTHAKAMLEKKRLEGVCLNIINHETPFGGEENRMELFTAKGEHITIPRMSKLACGFAIVKAFF